MCIQVYHRDVGRLNVVVDDELIERVMKLYGLATKRDAIDYALRRVGGDRSPRDILELEGMGWPGNLKTLRRSAPADL